MTGLQVAPLFRIKHAHLTSLEPVHASCRALAWPRRHPCDAGHRSVAAAGSPRQAGRRHAGRRVCTRAADAGQLQLNRARKRDRRPVARRCAFLHRSGDSSARAAGREELQVHRPEDAGGRAAQRREIPRRLAGHRRRRGLHLPDHDQPEEHRRQGRHLRDLARRGREGGARDRALQDEGAEPAGAAFPLDRRAHRQARHLRQPGRSGRPECQRAGRQDDRHRAVPRRLVHAGPRAGDRALRRLPRRLAEGHAD